MIDISSSSDRGDMIADLMPDLTPLLDVLFMLIIFLVLTINSAPQVFDISLPEDKDNITKASKDNNSISITLFPESNKWALNDQNFSDFNKFKSALVSKYNSSEEKQVMVFGDKSVTIDKLMSLLTFMRSKGIEAADIVMDN